MCKWNTDLQVPIIPALHGTDEPIAKSIITTSFVALARGDAGYYGKGLYFTTSAKYALPYFASKQKPVVLICYVITGNAYPVIEHPRAKNTLMGTALVPNFHSHYVLCRIDGNPIPRIMDKAEDETEYFDEIVIEQESNVLPFYLVKISMQNLSKLVMQIQEKQDKIRLEGDRHIDLDKGNPEGRGSRRLRVGDRELSLNINTSNRSVPTVQNDEVTVEDSSSTSSDVPDTRYAQFPDSKT